MLKNRDASEDQVKKFLVECNNDFDFKLSNVDGNYAFYHKWNGSNLLRIGILKVKGETYLSGSSPINGYYKMVGIKNFTQTFTGGAVTVPVFKFVTKEKLKSNNTSPVPVVAKSSSSEKPDNQVDQGSNSSTSEVIQDKASQSSAGGFFAVLAILGVGGFVAFKKKKAQA